MSADHVSSSCRQLIGDDRAIAADTIRRNHYTRSVPSGKSHDVQFGDAIVVWSIPANKNIARFVLGWDGNVWELSRLWAPDGHERNLLTQAISAAVKVIVRLEKPDALVSYADPNAGHKGGVYRAASWVYHGKSEEVRTYRAPDGTTVARRAFHSGRKGLRKAEIEALGYREEKLPGKERFVRPMSKRAARVIRVGVAEVNTMKKFDPTAFRAELKKRMPGFEWTVRRVSPTAAQMWAEGKQSAGFNRTATLTVTCDTKGWHEATYYGFGMKSKALAICGGLTVAKALRGLQDILTNQANTYHSGAETMRAARKESEAEKAELPA